MENKDYRDKVFLGDCLEGMRSMPDHCVDVTFTSPPYNDSGTENGDVTNSSDHRKYLDVEFREDWYEWLVECIDEMLRVSKKYVLVNVQAIISCRSDVYKLIGNYSDRIHDIIIWHKPNGQPCPNKHKISNRYEFLLILKCDGVKGVSVNSDYYTNVIVASANKDHKYSNIHRAVMSKPFCDEVISEFTQKGDLVLDPFFGMGTTGVCCIEQGRHYVGFELSETYHKMCIERLEKVKEEVDNGFHVSRPRKLF